LALSWVYLNLTIDIIVLEHALLTLIDCLVGSGSEHRTPSDYFCPHCQSTFLEELGAGGDDNCDDNDNDVVVCSGLNDVMGYLSYK